MKCSVTPHKECIAQVVEGFVSLWPCSLLVFVGWTQLDTAVMVTVCGIFLILPQRRYNVSGGANVWPKAFFGRSYTPAQQTHGRF